MENNFDDTPAFRKIILDKIDGMENKVDKLYKRTFESNGKPCLIEELNYIKKQTKWQWIALGLLIFGSGSAVTVNWKMIENLLAVM